MIKYYTIVFFVFLAGILQGQNRNFFEDTWQAKNFSIPTNYTLSTFTNAQVDATVNVFLNDSIRKITPVVLGVNTTFRSGSSMLNRVPLYEKSGWGTYRFPAGSGSNLYFWDGNIPSSFAIPTNPINGLQGNKLKPADFASFINTTGAQGTVVVNYFFARYGVTPQGTRDARVQQAADYAAAFVHKMNIELDAGIKYWEIGNECYGQWEHGWVVNNDTIDGTEYAEDFAVFAQTMKAVDPSIKVGAVLGWNKPTWNNEVIAGVKDVADFVIIHQYFTNHSPTVSQLRASISRIQGDANTVNDLTVNVAGKPPGYFPLAMTEYNTRGDYTTTMLNALLTVEMIGEQIKHGIPMAARWVGEWGWSSDTKGTIAKDDDPNQAPYTPRQAYMAYRYYDLYFGDYLLNANSSSNDIKVYASRFSNGKIGVSIINYSATDTNVAISINDLPQNLDLTEAYWYEIYADNINPGNQKFYINGETSITAGGGPEDFENVLPYRAAVTNNNPIFTAKKYSMNFIVFDTNNTNNIEVNNGNDDFTVYPNPFHNEIIVKGKQKIKNLKVYNLDGKLLYDINNPDDIINLDKLRSAWYFLHIHTDKDKTIKRIVKL